MSLLQPLRIQSFRRYWLASAISLFGDHITFVALPWLVLKLTGDPLAMGVVIAIAAFLINLSPPKLLGIFGQTGIYGLTAAAALPLLLGILFHRLPLALVWAGSAAALVIHFGLFFFGNQVFPSSSLTFGNPGVTAAIASLTTIPAVALIAAFVSKRR